VFWAGEVGKVAARASGAGGVEAPAPPEVALPRVDKTLANLFRFSTPSIMSAPEKSVVSQACQENSIRTNCKVCKKKQYK